MRRLSGILAVIAAGAAAGAWYMARPHSRVAPVGAPSPPPVTAPEPDPTPGRRTLEDRLRDAIAAVITPGTDHGAGLPEGVRLLSVKMETDVATVDLSREFVEVNHQGSTGEARAMESLRAALEPFAEVRAMDVLVEGAQFEGEHAGAWKDIPVHVAPAAGQAGQ